MYSIYYIIKKRIVYELKSIKNTYLLRMFLVLGSAAWANPKAKAKKPRFTSVTFSEGGKNNKIT
jgi:hypothetical protein